MTTTARTCLWFDGRVTEAARFYTELIPGSRIETTVDRPAEEGFPENMDTDDALLVNLEIAGQRFQLLNGGPHFSQSEAVSIVVHVDGQAEVDRVWDALVADGGAESQCGWCKDRFGVSWQVIPNEFEEIMNGPGAPAAAQALMSMTKIDLAAIRAAANG